MKRITILSAVLVITLITASWAQQEFRSGWKGATPGAAVTSTALGPDRQALDVNVAAIDLSLATTLDFTGQKANAGDTLILESSSMQLIP